MALRAIRTEGDDILRKKSKAVEKFDQKLWTLLDDMKDTLYKAEGAGLAAVQIGILRRVVLVDVGDGLLELINPEIISVEGEQDGDEGCLSVPENSERLSVLKSLRLRRKTERAIGAFIKVKTLKRAASAMSLTTLTASFIQMLHTRCIIPEKGVINL